MRDMTELEKLCEQALYDEVQDLSDGRSIVRDNASGKLFYRKRLAIYNPEVFSWLRDHKSRYVPRIESFWQDGEELVVIEELIQGKTLEQVLFDAEKEGGLPFEERIRILTELCDGLSFLHSAEPPIIHRDLKASNIMLTEDGVVKIIDYDAAKLYVKGQKRDTQLIGTQGSAAPEQYGFAASDARTDIYALGKLIERMLPENADAIRIAAKATKMDPARRYANAAQMREAIKRIREHPPALDHLLEKIPGYDPSIRKHRLMARFGIVIFCACILFMAAVIYEYCVIKPAKRQETIDNAIHVASDAQAQPKDIAEASVQLLRECPYDKMDTNTQEQFREMAKTVVRRYTSPKKGEPQETGMCLSKEGMDYVAAIQELGVDERTANAIRIGGQLRYCLKINKWEEAFQALTYLEGLPDEETEREAVYEACSSASEKYEQKFEGSKSSANASAALEFYSRLKNVGYGEAEKLLGNFYRTVLSSAHAQRDAGEYDKAIRLYEVLRDYEKDVVNGDSEPTITEQILECGYLQAQEKMDSGDYPKARSEFTELGEYRDAADKANECAYLLARKYASDAHYDKAASLYAEIPGYKEADTLCLEAKYNYCSQVLAAPDDLSYGYIEELVAAEYPGAREFRDKMFAWHADIETGLELMLGPNQAAAIRATLSSGPPDGTTHIRFDLIDNENGETVTWTSEEECARGESSTVYYQLTSYTVNIFEKNYTVNVYSDDGALIGSWSGCFSQDFLKDLPDS